MDMAITLLVLAVVLTLVFDFINGFHDCANAIATVVSTRVLKPRTAVMYGAALNFIGAMMGTQVAATVGKGLVESGSITIGTVLCTVTAAIVWNLITWWKGLPTSSSHALIGSLIGATTFSAGWGSVKTAAVTQKVLIPMVVSPMLGIGIGFALMLALTWMVYKFPLGRINAVFGKLQLVSAGFMALNHGQNDAQKSMGIIALALVLTYHPEHFSVPTWVVVSCAVAMGLGTMAGGWRIIHTMGSKMIKLQPIHGFAAETTAAAILGVTAHLGIPVSTTQVISTSIMGVGATRGLSAVRWGIVGNIVWAWILTLPLTFLFAGLLMTLYRMF
jgi:inorganic phosphate transporter, PiT family